MERSTHTLAVKSQKWLVEALLALIKQKPYDEISISALCKEAKLDRRTFYRNFKDKNDILFFYFSDLQKEYLLTLNETQGRTFYSLASGYFKFWASHMDFFKTAQSDQTLNAALFQMLNTFIPTIYSEADGSIKNELQYSIALVLGGLHNVLIQWISCGFHETPEEMAAIVSNMFKDNIYYWPKP